MVVVSTELTADLIEEGIYRELLNRIQTLRKDLGLEYTQRIKLAIAGSDQLNRILDAHREHFMKETLCVELSEDGLEEAETRDVEIEGASAKISLANA